MGLIKAIAGATGGVLGDQWKEFFYCEALPCDILVTKGEKRTSKRSSNKKGEDNIITTGSVLAVNDGQCMLIVDQGKVAEVCAEPGEVVYDASTEPTIFCGHLGEGIKESFKKIGYRFTFGGDTAHDQRVYYINTKEIFGNKYGTAAPVPFRVIDKNINLDMDVSVRCFGEYSFRIIDPVLFYTNVCGNVPESYGKSDIDSQLKSELLTALQPAFARIAAQGVRYSEIAAHTMEIARELDDILSESWKRHRGIEIVNFGISSITVSEDDLAYIKKAQASAVNKDPNMAAATLVGAQARAMEAAASNENAGAFMGFAGLNMAQNATGNQASTLFRMGAEQAEQAAQAAQSQQAQAGGNGAWTCKCGMNNIGNFCSNCGEKKPDGKWLCECGMNNTGNFCSNCGKKRP